MAIEGGVNWLWFFLFVLMLFIVWTEVIMIGFLAIIISRTLFLNSRFAGLFSVVLFFVINWIIERGYALMCRITGGSTVEIQIQDYLYYVIVGIILFIVSGILADKKLSV